MTAATPITTPTSVRTLRSLCAQRLEAEMATASVRFIVLGDRGAVDEDTGAIDGSGDSGHIVSYALEVPGITCPEAGKASILNGWRNFWDKKEKGAPIGSGRPGRQPSRQIVQRGGLRRGTLTPAGCHG